MHSTRRFPALLLLLALSGSPALAESPPRLLAEIDADSKPLVECPADAETLCLLEGRLQVKGRWKNQHAEGSEGTAKVLTLSDKTGLLWFFTPDNVEVVIKALDGDRVNGKFWVFLGSLSNVEFWVDVTNTTTGDTRTYYNPPGHLYGVADTAALPAQKICGTIAGLGCAARQVCDLQGGCNLADAAGVCILQPDVCTEDFAPVCGCDGVTYTNECERRAAGVVKDHDGLCASP